MMYEICKTLPLCLKLITTNLFLLELLVSEKVIQVNYLNRWYNKKKRKERNIPGNSRLACSVDCCGMEFSQINGVTTNT